MCEKDISKFIVRMMCYFYINSRNNKVNGELNGKKILLFSFLQYWKEKFSFKIY